jgi:NAD(P)-dependent dehydrogenase (short-subunit alcohol dehydrogenase family)
VTRRFAGKIVIVTGGGKGMGQAIALRLAHEGADVAIFDRDGAAAADTATQIEQAGGRALPLPVDITRFREVDAAVARIAAQWGGIDVLVSNAGIMHPEDDMAALSGDAVWRTTFAVNLHGAYACIRAALPHLRERRGAIVVSASNAGTVGTARPVYGASKAALIAMTLAVAREVAADGVRANVVLPGAFATPMLDVVRHYPLTARYPRHRPIDRIADPGEIAGAVAFLASSDARHISGTVVPVDGGSTAA